MGWALTLGSDTLTLESVVPDLLSQLFPERFAASGLHLFICKMPIVVQSLLRWLWDLNEINKIISYLKHVVQLMPNIDGHCYYDFHHSDTGQRALCAPGPRKERSQVQGVVGGMARPLRPAWSQRRPEDITRLAEPRGLVRRVAGLLDCDFFAPFPLGLAHFFKLKLLIHNV